MNLAERRREFNKNVWDHSKDPFQLQFDVRRKLNQNELDVLQAVAEEVKRTDDDAVLSAFLKKHIAENGKELTAVLLQVCGLTRSKIISDLKASSAGVSVPSSYGRLHLDDSWQKSGPYLAASLRRVFQPLTAPFDEGAFEAINQATYPGYIRQERAKRSGHEAEYRLAVLMQNTGLPFEPVAKSENPLCADQIIHGVSFDLVVPSADVPKLVIKSTVHTSNIGQYGESKDDLEVKEAKEMLLNNYQPKDRPVLLALIDGVGFWSNRAGLNGVLTSADEFCQFSTLWKAVVIAADRMGLQSHLFGPVDYFSEFQAFLSRYPRHILTEERPEDSVEAGRAYVTVT